MKIRINEKINCLIIYTLLILRMYSGASFFAIIAFLLMILGIIFTSNSKRSIYLFGFMQWQYVFKISYKSFSLFTFVTIFYVCIQCVFCIKNKIINKKTLTCLLLLFIITVISMISSMEYDISDLLYSISWLMNLISVLLINCLLLKAKEVKESILWVVFSTVLGGIVGLLGRYVINNFNFYTVYKSLPINVNGIIFYRLTGVDIDPNFYALQVLMSITLLIPLKLNNRMLKNTILTILILFGILTISKMFIITLICLLVLMIFLKRKIITKALLNIRLKHIIFIITISAIIIYASPKVYNIYFSRLSDVDDMNGLTSGRSEIWKNYSETIFTNFKIMLIGNGISTKFLNGFSAHNAFLSGIYEIGIIGFIVFILFYKFMMDTTKEKNEIIISNKKDCYLALVVLIIASFSLDTFGIDYFPLTLFLTTRII